VSKERARTEARKLLKQFGIDKAPINVERIARNLGIRIQFAPFDGELSGMAFIKDGIPIIGINSLHHPHRQRFTLAHELAHIQLHREEIEAKVHVDMGVLRRDSLASAGVDQFEIQANTFASELLIPEDLLEEILAGRSLDIEDVDMVASLAKRFKVSEAAMKYRLLAFE